MIDKADLRELSPKTSSVIQSAAHIASGTPILPQQRVTLFSPEEWEEFTEEWATSLEDEYVKVARFGGSGDYGLDVVGFTTDHTFDGGWDNYQCKRYASPLAPSDIWKEIGKIIYYSFKGEYCPPRKYYFVASNGIGTTLQRLLAKPDELKNQARDNWAAYCESNITSKTKIPLTGTLSDWFERFDFSIFSSKSIVELIKGHANTPFHSLRFGGGLPCRPKIEAPPAVHQPSESRYIQQLLEAYSDHSGTSIKDVSELTSSSQFGKDCLRQRERFYHAESLRNFARDTVPEGTFESLQDEMFHGVIETCEGEHESGFSRMKATVAQAATIPITSNPLSSVVQVQDKQGICHQLANEDRLLWIPEKVEVAK